jgi:hypothetical protein
MCPNQSSEGVSTGPCKNFLLHYRPLAKVWTLFDNSGEIPNVIAFERDETIRIIGRSAYTALVKRYGRT